MPIFEFISFIRKEGLDDPTCFNLRYRVAVSHLAFLHAILLHLSGHVAGRLRPICERPENAVLLRCRLLASSGYVARHAFRLSVCCENIPLSFAKRGNRLGVNKKGSCDFSVALEDAAQPQGHRERGKTARRPWFLK